MSHMYAVNATNSSLFSFIFLELKRLNLIFLDLMFIPTYSKAGSMDFDFIKRLQKISLTEEEEGVIAVRGDHRKQVLDECSLSFMGRFLSEKPLNLRAAKNTLGSVWKFGSDLKIVEVEDGLLQFKFSLDSQLKWVLDNGPWCFDDHLLVLRRWEKGMTAIIVTFPKIQLWVQIWGLPFDLMNEEAGREIGGRTGTGSQDEVCLTRTELERWAIVSWAIWNARNKYCFVDTQAHPESILRSALFFCMNTNL